MPGGTQAAQKRVSFDPLAEIVTDEDDETVKEQLAEVVAQYYQDNPGIDRLRIEERRTWEAYLRGQLREKKNALTCAAPPPMKPCPTCETMNKLIETECTECYSPFVLLIENSVENAADVRMSHALKRGIIKADVWVFSFRG